MENYIDQYKEYLLKEKKFSLHTVQAYSRDVELFWDFLSSKEVVLSQVEYLHVREWIVTLSSDGITNTTINRKAASLKSYFRFLYITQTIASYPLEGHKPLRAEKELQVPFSEQEMLKVERNEFKNDFYGLQNFVIISLFYSSGIRKSELIELELHKIDLVNQEIRVLGKRNKERIVPLINEIAEMLRGFIAERAGQFGAASCDKLFLSKKGKKINQTFVYRLINDYFRRVTSKGKRSPHVLRHTFATHMLNAGANLNTIKEILGHSSLSSTQIYTHTSLTALNKTYAQAHPRFRADDKD